MQPAALFTADWCDDWSDHDLLREARYDFVNPQFAELFLPTAKRGARLDLLEIVDTHLDGAEALMADLQARGLSPAGTRDLLKFGARYPGIQKHRWPIIAVRDLDERDWDPPRMHGLAPALSSNEDGRRLGMILIGEWAARGYWVLAVRS